VQALHSTRRVCLIEHEDRAECAAAKPVEWPLQLQAATADGGSLEQELPAMVGETQDEGTSSADVISIVPRVSQGMIA
jgi:hypothetical protein